MPRLLGTVASVAVFAVLAACGQDAPLTTPDGQVISTTTTRVAEVNIVNADRDYSRTCLAPTAPDDGATDVSRIVVTDPSLLDAVCALGIGPKVTAVAADGPVPAYLGPQLTSVPVIGATPDATAVDAADPDVVLTTPQTSATAKSFGDARVVTIEPGQGWEDRFGSVATALGRSASGSELLADFEKQAARTGRFLDAAHNQISLVRFTGDSEVIAGNDTFAGQILGMIGVQRPEPQRSAESTTVTDENFTDADGDLIYVSFVGDDGLEHGSDVLLSDRWLNMGAPTWKRVLSVDDEIWYESSGLAAAWLVLNDVKESINGNS